MPISFTTTHRELTLALDAMTAMSGRAVVPGAALARITVHPEPNDTYVTVIDSFDFTTHVSVTLKTLEATSGDDFNIVHVDRANLALYIRSLTAGSSKTKQADLPVTVYVTHHDDHRELNIQSDGYTFTLPVDDSTEFPRTPLYVSEDVVTVDRDLMLNTVTRLQVSAAKDDKLPLLTGINFKSVPGGLELATTDRFRLGLAFVATPEESNINRLVPAKELAKLFRYLPAGTVTCGFTTDPGAQWVRFVSGQVTISTQWIDQDFVKYASLLPSKWAGEAVVSRGDLAVAVKRARNFGTNVRLRFADSTVSVTAGHDQEGRVASPPFRTVQTGDDMGGVIAFNSKWLEEVLGTFTSDAIAIRYDTPSRPILVAEPGELDNSHAFRTLLMPARLPA